MYAMNARKPIAAFAVTTAIASGVMLHEGFRGAAYVPVKGDVPTIGYGSTRHIDGSAVQLGDSIDRQTATRYLMAYLQTSDNLLKSCVTGALTQGEYEILHDFAYQYGTATACKSSMVRAINRGDYAAQCKAYLKYKFVAGYDCSTPGNTRCMGVWTRQLERYNKCLKEQVAANEIKALPQALPEPPAQPVKAGDASRPWWRFWR